MTPFVAVSEIEWIESAGVYLTVRRANRQFLRRASMKELGAALNPRRFIRVHRSAIVNSDRTVQLVPVSHGEFAVVLMRGARTRISRLYRPELAQRREARPCSEAGQQRLAAAA